MFSCLIPAGCFEPGIAAHIGENAGSPSRSDGCPWPRCGYLAQLDVLLTAGNEAVRMGRYCVGHAVVVGTGMQVAPHWSVRYQAG